jgi:hypothetical protein
MQYLKHAIFFMWTFQPLLEHALNNSTQTTTPSKYVLNAYGYKKCRSFSGISIKIVTRRYQMLKCSNFL